MIKIVLIDNTKEDMRKTRRLLSSQRDFRVVGSGMDGYDALKLVQGFQPDITVSELNLKYISGAEIVPLLRRASPSTRMIVFTKSQNENHILSAVRGGAAGYFLKGDDSGILPKYIRDIHSGNQFFTSVVANTAIRLLVEHEKRDARGGEHPREVGWPILENLSKTELQVMGSLAEGLTNKEIAETLGIAYGTVRNCVSSIIKKTGLRDRTKTALFAFQSGLRIPTD
ncbi:MAG: DNA-binding response regulator [Treponematales bacterium]